MSITSALYTGVTGLQAMGNSIQVVGNNIANSNTVGFKAMRADFSDLLYQSLNTGGNSSQLGRGVQIETISRHFAQGAFLNSTSVTDMAINGRGFFIVSDGNGSFYTRAGNFKTNSNGDLINTDGLGVQGYLYNAVGQPSGIRGTINLSNLTSAPQMTSSINIGANVSADSSITAFDIANPGNTSAYSTSMTVYDSLGRAHNMILYFNKVQEYDATVPQNSQWEWHAVVDGAEVNDDDPLNPPTPTAGMPWETGFGTLEFNGNGQLIAQTGSATFNFTGGATQGQTIMFDFGDDIASGGTGLGGTTQFAGPSVTDTQTQNGYPAGSLEDILVDGDGFITGVFSNGRTRTVAQLALANFQNEGGLYAVGSNLFVETPHSGQPTVSAPNTGATGSVSGNSLESSNVDLSNEFVTLIINQRAFQANSRIVSTGNDMLQVIVQLGQ